MHNSFRVLSEEQVDQFLQHGYLVVKGCLDLDLARRWTDRAYERLGFSKDDPATWDTDFAWMYPENRLPVRQISERAWLAICDVVGGEERIEPAVLGVEGHYSSINSFEWSDAFVVNLRHGRGETWCPPSADVEGWHQDGNYFRHFLNSREQALLTILLWSDVAHQGGGTFIAPDSVRHVARYLADHPEGVSAVPGDEIIQQCSEFVEITGEIGDFFILHPFMLHTRSQNVLGKARFMSNPPIVLKEPLQLNRAAPEDFSLLERATLHGLGMERLDFQPTAPYEAYWSVQPG